VTAQDVGELGGGEYRRIVLDAQTVARGLVSDVVDARLGEQLGSDQVPIELTEIFTQYRVDDFHVANVRAG
jgi:hypothetical protein